MLALLIASTINVFIIAPSEEVYYSLKHVLTILYIINISWILIHAIRLFKHFILGRYDIHTRDNLKARKVYTQFKIIERILIVMVVVIAFSVSLMTFESIRKIGVSIFASAGVAGIILGLAAQKVIGGILAGFQIAITQPIRLGDAVIVENEWGWIEEINLTYVVIKVWDLRRLVVPTTYFIEKPFQNWTRSDANIMGTVFIHTDYSIPFKALRDELTRLLNASKFWDGKVNVMQVTDAKERSVEIRMLMSAVDSPTAWNLRVEVREKLIEFLQQNYPQSLPRTRLILEDSRPNSMPTDS
ncbi:MAG: mechanosensitive ion channel [Bacteroidetes bacterium]|nr:mechanosensitive ion channel [Bacteroidota bacterium]